MTGEYGAWTEKLARAAAAESGKPDFVCRPATCKKGSGRREIGDHLILLGHQLIVVNVKSRDITRAGLDSPARARSWLDKNIRGRSARTRAHSRR